MPCENPDLTPEDEDRLLPLVHGRMDLAARAAVRRDIAAGRYREALSVLRAVLRRLKQEEALGPPRG